MTRLFILLFLSSFNLYAYTGEVQTPQQALDRLIKGNKRYIQDRLLHPNRTEYRRMALVTTQKPFAAILGCSDSRVAPEIIFDQGIGELFVVRVAGNVVGNIELESIEYALIHLDSILVLVMGHENCGAVDAVIGGHTQDIEAIAEMIEPSVKRAKRSRSKNLLEFATKLNAIKMKNILIKHPVINKLVKAKKIQIQAAYYHLDTGRVQLL